MSPVRGDNDKLTARPGRNGQATVLYVPQARETADPDAGFIDAINFSMSHDDLRRVLPSWLRAIVQWDGPDPLTCESKVIEVAAEWFLGEVFGFEVGPQRSGGLNFYARTWQVTKVDKATGEVLPMGFVSIGGQRDTVLFQITGTGCHAAAYGWERRLFALGQATEGKRYYRAINHQDKVCFGGMERFVITRLDVAYDDYEAEHVTVDRALAWAKGGQFSLSNRVPSIEQRGDWINPSGKGRTLYVGKRESGKLCRVYEKGRQLGDVNSEWVRVEVEWHNRDRVIPLDALVRPGQYLAGAYEALAWICQRRQRIDTQRREWDVSYKFLVREARRCYGRLISLMLGVEGDLESVVRSLQREGVPARLRLPQETPVLPRPLPAWPGLANV